MMDSQRLSKVLDQLSKAGNGMGTRNPDDYTFMLTVGEAIALRDYISRLKDKERILDSQGSSEADWFFNEIPK